MEEDDGRCGVGSVWCCATRGILCLQQHENVDGNGSGNKKFCSVKQHSAPRQQRARPSSRLCKESRQIGGLAEGCVWRVFAHAVCGASTLKCVRLLFCFFLLFALLSRRLLVVLEVIDSIHVLLFQDTTPNTQLDAIFCWHRRKHTYMYHVSEPPPARPPLSACLFVLLTFPRPCLVLSWACLARLGHACAGRFRWSQWSRGGPVCAGEALGAHPGEGWARIHCKKGAEGREAASPAVLLYRTV